MNSELGTSIGPMTKLFVCYDAVTALMERFCQNAFAPREAMAAGSRTCHLRVQPGRRPIAPSRPWGSARPLNCLRQLPGSLHRGQWDDGSLRMHWRCRRSAFAPHCGLRTAFLPCATNTLLNSCQGRRFAQAALKLCGSLEQRRDLGTCPTFTSLNAELVACHTSSQRTSRQHERDHPHTAGRNGDHHWRCLAWSRPLVLMAVPTKS
jgi:hypothetical protein